MRTMESVALTEAVKSIQQLTDEKATFEKFGGLRKIIDAGVKALAMENNNVSN